jgi:hypothetical protein
MPHLNVSKIHDRYKMLALFLANKTLPPRDYDISYSEEKITTLHKLGKLTRKADKELVDKWLKKGAKEGTLKLEMGDFECKMCTYRDKCWDKESSDINKQLSNLPKIEELKDKLKQNNYNLKSLW